MKLLMLRGLPASGKSTYAVSLKGWVRVNKDDIRLQYPLAKENDVIAIQDQRIKDGLAQGMDVVVDDCNLNPYHKERLMKIAEKHGAVFEIKNFTDVSVDECILHDSKREKSVGEKVIRDMYNKYLRVEPVEKIEYNPDLPSCYIFDVDGTLALNLSGRGYYDWKRVKEDTPNEPVVNVLRKLKPYHNVLIMSGRDGVCEKDTYDWLTENMIPFNGLIMRKKGDMRKDNIIKRELFDEHIRGKYNVLGVFDDRDSVVKMWREMGFTCFQVNYGNF